MVIHHRSRGCNCLLRKKFDTRVTIKARLKLVAPLRLRRQTSWVSVQVLCPVQRLQIVNACTRRDVSALGYRPSAFSDIRSGSELLRPSAARCVVDPLCIKLFRNFHNVRTLPPLLWGSLVGLLWLFYALSALLIWNRNVVDFRTDHHLLMRDIGSSLSDLKGFSLFSRIYHQGWPFGTLRTHFATDWRWSGCIHLYFY